MANEKPKTVSPDEKAVREAFAALQAERDRKRAYNNSPERKAKQKAYRDAKQAEKDELLAAAAKLGLKLK
jgi:hypothetical protein